jgi:hypothetical protein
MVNTIVDGHGGVMESATTLVRTPSLTAVVSALALALWSRTQTSSSARATSSMKKRDWRWGRENTSPMSSSSLGAWL